MNIRREFLYNENKLIPVQLMRTNYGISEANPITSLDTITDTASARTMTVKFPYGSSNIAMMINKDNDQILEIRSTPPNQNFVNVTVKLNTTYYLYVVSREYKDGYVSGELKVTQSPAASDRIVVTYETARDLIDLSTAGAMTISSGRNTDDITQWYGYNDHYEGGLIWSQPPGTSSSTGTPKNLIFYRSVLTDMISIFKIAGATEDAPSTVPKALKSWQAHDNVIKYIRELDGDAFLSNIQEVSDLIDYLRSNDNTRSVYVSETGVYEAHEEVEAMLAAMIYGAMDTSYFGNTLLFDFSTASLNDQTSEAHDPQDGYYTTIKGRANNQTYLTKYPNLFPKAENIYGRVKQGTRLPTYEERADGWSLGPGGDDKDGPMARRMTAGLIATDLREIRNGVNLLFTGTFGLPLVNSDATRILLEEEIIRWAEKQQSNVLGYIKNELERVDTAITDYGLSIFYPSEMSGGMIDGSGPIANVYLTPSTGTTPPFMVVGLQNPNAPVYLSERDLRPIENPGHVANGIPRSSWVWYYLRTSGIIPNNYADWDRNKPYSQGMAGVALFDEVFPEYGISSEEWAQTRDWITSNRDLVWDITYESPSATTTNNLFPQAQEAILQNLRFVKDLINSVDENLWASYTNTSSLMLASLIKIQENMVAQPAKSTIVNFTNATVRNGNIEALWKRFGGEWSSLSTQVLDIGNNVKVIDLNTADFSGVGKYIILLQPRHTTVNITSTRNDYAIIKDELDEGRTANYYYGYNAQIKSTRGEPIQDQKVVVESQWNASSQYLKLSPIISNWTTLGRDLKLELWSSEFEPVLIEIDVVEQNALTLSYSMYAKKEFNTDTGLCTIYDYTGKPYKQLTFGKYSNPATGGDIIEYRIQAEDTNKP